MFRLGFNTEMLMCVLELPSLELGKLGRMRVFECVCANVHDRPRRPTERKKKRNGKCKKRRLCNTETKR